MKLYIFFLFPLLRFSHLFAFAVVWLTAFICHAKVHRLIPFQHNSSVIILGIGLIFPPLYLSQLALTHTFRICSVPRCALYLSTIWTQKAMENVFFVSLSLVLRTIIRPTTDHIYIPHRSAFIHCTHIIWCYCCCSCPKRKWEGERWAESQIFIWFFVHSFVRRTPSGCCCCRCFLLYAVVRHTYFSPQNHYHL